MAKSQTKHVCQQCGYESPKWLGRCPDCNQWNSFSEEMVAPVAGRRKEPAALFNLPKPISEITVGAQSRRSSGIL
jgi:DNA repair protein RadA/Sms